MVLGKEDPNLTVLPVKGKGTSNGHGQPHGGSIVSDGASSKVYIEMDDRPPSTASTHRIASDPASNGGQEGATETMIGNTRQFPPDTSVGSTGDYFRHGERRNTNGEAVSKVTVSGSDNTGNRATSNGAESESEPNGRKVSRKVGVFNMSSPPHTALYVRSDDAASFADSGTNGHNIGTSEIPKQTAQQSKGDSVQIVVTEADNMELEMDSGVDTEAGTPSPDAPCSKTFETPAGEDPSDPPASRFQLHPVYERRPGALKGTRKLSQDMSERHMGAPRKISFQHVRKVSQGSESSNQFVPSRKGSMVMIDQIPHIINASLQTFLQQSAIDAGSVIEEDDYPDTGAQRSRAPRMSVFSIQTSRRSSQQSDVTFWDPEESLPHADHYRHLHAHSLDLTDGFRPRPTLYQLREEPESPTKSSVVSLGEDLPEDKEDAEEGQKKEVKIVPQAKKTGWIQGVLVRCLLNIFGVMLFLRLTWITGQAGIGLATVIILLSSVVTTLTTMSMAAICTNGEVRGGGAYYMISRSLGPEFGGAIGVIFSLANAVAAAMYVVGFAETLRDLVKDNGGVITGDMLHDVRVIGAATTVLLLAVVMIGLDFETKAQLVLLVILTVSIINFVVGTFIPPDEEKRRVGFVGYQGEVFLQNIGPDFRENDGVDYSFFKVFAIFFPAATGILAGANISGDLKNPSSAIPKGTFLAIFITTLVYVLIVWTTGSSMLRDAVGTAVAIATNVTLSLEDIQQCGNTTCQYGLHNSHAIMGVASAFEPLIYAGIFSATLSSALASLVSAPKVFQALGKDNLFPFISYFAKGFGKAGEPRRGYILTFVICIAMTCIGSLDIIAPIISNFFLMAYTLINFACFDAAFANSPGFRPSFHLYNKWLSLVGALLCLVIMFMLEWWAALVTVIVIAALYVYIKHRKPDVNWGSSGQAHAYNDALKSTLKLMDVDEHVKNFRPQILVLTGYPRNRPALVDLAASITKRQSLLVCAHIFKGDMQNHLKHLRSTAAYRWFKNRQIRAFYTSIAAPTIRHGTQALLQSQGLGKLRPNTLLIGFKNSWQIMDPRTVHNYVGIIHDAFDLHYGVGVLRVPGGLDTHKVTDILLDSTDDTLDDLHEDSMDDDVSEADDDDNDPRRKTTIFSETSEATTPSDRDVALKNFNYTPNSGVGNSAYDSGSNDDDDDEDDDDEKDDNKEEENKGETDQKNTEDSEAKSQTTDKENEGETQNQKNDGTQDSTEKLENGTRTEDEIGAGGLRRAYHSVLSKSESLDESAISGRFRNKQQGTIDVWWLFDDGGLGLLLPYILSTRKQWRHCKLRVFCTGTKRANLDADQQRMASLLAKFRIDYSDITVLPDLKKKPRRSSYKEFQEVIYRWRLWSGETQEDYPWKISDADLAAHKEKIYMQIRIREKLLEHSKDASLIVVTLPVPRKFCPAGLYMAWLDTLTRDLPPTLLLRGNQQSVLTYFS